MKNIAQNIFLAFGLLTILLSTYSFFKLAVSPPPFEYVFKNYSPVSVCAGDTIAYPLRIAVHTAPAVVEINESWFSLDELYTVIPDRETSVVVHTRAITVERVARRVVPAELKPGAYEFRQGGHGSTGASDAYTIKVEVMEC